MVARGVKIRRRVTSLAKGGDGRTFGFCREFELPLFEVSSSGESLTNGASPRPLSNIGGINAMGCTPKGELWEKLDLRSPDLSTAYRGLFAASPASPKIRTGLQIRASSGRPLNSPRFRDANPCTGDLRTASSRAQSPEKHPIFARAVMSTKTKESSSSSKLGRG